MWSPTKKQSCVKGRTWDAKRNGKTIGLCHSGANYRRPHTNFHCRNPKHDCRPAFLLAPFSTNPPGFQLPIPNCTFRVRPTSIRFARLLPCSCRFRVSDLLSRKTSPIFRSRKISACWESFNGYKLMPFSCSKQRCAMQRSFLTFP